MAVSRLLLSLWALGYLCGCQAGSVDIASDHCLDSKEREREEEQLMEDDFAQGAHQSLLQLSFDHASTSGEKPWDQRAYYIAAWHKSGIEITNHLLGRWFGELGANYSTDVCSEGDPYTGSCYGCDSTEVPVQHYRGATPETLQRFTDYAAGESTESRVVLAIRDPLEIVVSSYCYHHDGQEGGNLAFHPDNIMDLDPEEGVLAQAIYMRPFIERMVQVYQLPASNRFIFRMEEYTSSSSDFDAQINQMIDFLFDDLITPEEKQMLTEQSWCEDLNRDISCDLPPCVTLNDDHSSDPDCKEAARAALGLLPTELMAFYQLSRAIVGYK